MKSNKKWVAAFLIPLTLMLVGCNSNVSGAVTAVANALPHLTQLAADLSVATGDPKLTSTFAKAATAAAADLKVVQDVVAAYQGNQSKSNLTKVSDAVSAFANDMSAGLLAANQINSSATEVKVLAAIATAADALAIGLAIAQGLKPSTTMSKVWPYLDHDQLKQDAARYDLNYNQVEQLVLGE